MSKALWSLLAWRAAETPDLVLLEDDHNRRLTARQWQLAAEALAGRLGALGVKEGSTVSWQLPTRLESAVVVMALARLGAVSNPVLPILRSRELGFIVGQTGAELLITMDHWRRFDYRSMAQDVADLHGCRLLILEDGNDWLERVPPDGPPPGAAPAPGTGRAAAGAGSSAEPVRHVYYTSGTTAEPKGARHTDRSVMATAAGILSSWDVGAGDCIPIPFPYTHMGGMTFTTVSLQTGCRLLLVESFDPEASPVLMARRGATLLGSAVPFYHAYLDAQRRHGTDPLFGELRSFIGGGAPRPAELHNELKAVFGVGVAAGWGLTECPVATCARLDDSDEHLALTEGRPAPGIDLRVVDASGRVLPPGQEGELRVKGPQLFRGYVDAALDAEAFDEQGYLRTGDLGVVGAEGHVRITGRLKDVIIRNAENLSAQEIEDVLYQHPKVADVAVVGLPDARTGERACAVVVAAPGSSRLTLEEIAAFCREHHLANQKIPEQLEFAESLPRNGMGKVIKTELRRRYAT